MEALLILAVLLDLLALKKLPSSVLNSKVVVIATDFLVKMMAAAVKLILIQS